MSGSYRGYIVVMSWFLTARITHKKCTVFKISSFNPDLHTIMAACWQHNGTETAGKRHVRSVLFFCPVLCLLSNFVPIGLQNYFVYYLLYYMCPKSVHFCPKSVHFRPVSVHYCPKSGHKNKEHPFGCSLFSNFLIFYLTSCPCKV